jgi:hypothetical protein
MAKSKLSLENSALNWDANRRYKVNAIVSYSGNTYQNLTGENSEPGVGSDWFKIPDSSGGGGGGPTNTDELPEGSTNLYFTTARVLASLLTGISFITGGAVVSTDTVLQAFGKIQNSLNDLYSKTPTSYTNIVYVNATSPTTATIFDLANPPITNNNALKSDVNNLYVGTDASTWVYNSGTSSYVTKVVSPSGLGVKVWNVKDYGALGNGSTDDTLAIQNTINLCFNAGGGIVYFPNGIYYINGSLDSNSQSQIYFPLSSYSSSINLKTIKLLGETPPNQYSNPVNVTGSKDHPNTGVIIKSNLLTAGNVIGCRNETVSWGVFNFIHAKIENISVRVRSMTGSTDVIPQTTAINMGAAANYTAQYIEVCTTSKMADSLEPATTCNGVIMPKQNNFTFSNMNNFNCWGVYKAVDCYEHTSLDNFLIDGCVIGLNFNTVNHSINVAKGCIARCRINFQTQNSSYFYVSHVTLENDPLKGIPTPTWNRTLYDLYDVDATSSGLIRCHIVRTNYGVDYSSLLRNRTNSKIKFIKINEISTEFNPNNVAPPTGVNLLAYWKFEEATGNYIDSSVNGRTASRVNAATSGAGKIGNAMLTLSSSAQYANAGNTGLSYNGTEFSFAGWFKINTNANAYQVLLNKGTSSAREYNLYYRKSDAKLLFSVYTGTALAGPEAIITSMVENVWFFVYGEIVGSAIKLSVNNGPLMSSTLTTAASTSTSADLFIGNGDTAGSSLNGGVDELRIYGRSLTSGEREYLYNGGYGN